MSDYVSKINSDAKKKIFQLLKQIKMQHYAHVHVRVHKFNLLLFSLGNISDQNDIWIRRSKMLSPIYLPIKQ